MKNVSLLFGLCVWLMLAGRGLAASIPPPTLLELHVKNVIYLHETRSPVVILVDKDEKQFLPIWIGLSEAQAIAMELGEYKPPRPMTHDLMRDLIREMDGEVQKLVITEIRENTYYGNLTVQIRGKSKEIDCRPSDGIALALRVKAPIFAAESVMRNALPVPEEALISELGAQRLDELKFTVQTLTPELAEALHLSEKKGALVSQSERKEILRGDVILAVDDTAVADASALSTATKKRAANREIVLKVLREGNIITVRLR